MYTFALLLLAGVDLGTWGSLYTHIKHDKGSNALVGKTLFNMAVMIVLFMFQRIS